VMLWLQGLLRQRWCRWGLLLHAVNRYEGLQFNGSTVAVVMVKSGSVWGANRMGKASIYRGFQSTHSQGRVQENIGLNRLEIMILEIRFDRGSKLSEMKTSTRLGIRPEWSDCGHRWSDCHGDMRPVRGPLGPHTGNEAWLALGQPQGTQGFWPNMARRKINSSFYFPNHFQIANQIEF
jgi:hypothetical protein